MMAAPNTYLNNGFWPINNAHTTDVMPSGEIDVVLYAKGQRVLIGRGDTEVEPNLWGQVGVIEVVPVPLSTPGTDTPQPEQTYVVVFPGGSVASLLEHQFYPL